MDEVLLRSVTPSVLTVLVRRGADFAAAEDAVQEALVEALRAGAADAGSAAGAADAGSAGAADADAGPRASGDGALRDPKGWLITVAWHKFLDARRADAARRRREDRVEEEPPPGPVPAADDTLQLYFLCAHPSLTPASAVALTLRAVGGLTTRQIARAYLVPEATMAQRISRAKRTVSGVRLDRPGDVATVLRVLYLVFNEGYSGDVDLSAEAIRLTRQLAARVDHPEVAGLLALMLLHHARRAARTGADGSLVPLAEQDRGRWDTALIAEGVGILQVALARDRLGEFQAQAAIAALHADAPTAAETDWAQIVEWYDELVGLTANPVARLNRAVAVGEADGPHAGLAALAGLDASLPRHTAAAAYLHERAGDLATAARLYAEAAHKAPHLAERDHLTRQAARLNTRRQRS
ncbi:RNA polymerase sigma factor [Streptomyces sp. NPDC012421]|uniref:RNA polymerase sigma factor n=1 Tax=Streptomyces sp. NPDC012421 TaxID=3364832 RepID=UPI0036ECC94C